MSSETFSLTDKHNATISYCFLAVFMLISRQERYQNPFLRAHARYATILHIGFLVLLFFLLTTGSLESFVFFDAVNLQFSFISVILFLLFFLLLIIMGMGISRAIRGLPPRFRIDNPLNHASIESIGKTDIAEENEKIPLILSHVPFLGIYLAERYGHSLIYGARWSTWITVIAALLLWLDPSLFLLILWIIAATLWVVHQAVTVFSDNTIHLMGEKFPSARDVQIWIRSIYRYAKALIHHDTVLPHWSDILDHEKDHIVSAPEEVISPALALPIINLIRIFPIWKKAGATQSLLQGLLLSIIFILGVWYTSASVIILIMLASMTGFLQIHHHRFLYIPFFSECALLIMKLLEWKKQKSAPHTTQFTPQ